MEKDKVDSQANQAILFISVRADYGGGPEHIYRLLENISQTKYKAFVACPNEQPYWSRFSEIVGSERMLDIPHRRFTLKYLFAMYWYIRKNKIRIIHSHGKGAGVYGRMLALLTGIPCIHTFHGVHVDQYSNWQKKLYYCLERFFSLLSSRIIAVSPGEAGLIKSAKLCSHEKLVIIPNGVNVSTPITDFSHGREGKFKIISMSRFDYSKNSELIVPIFKYLKGNNRIHQFQLVFLGTGPGLPDLKEQIVKYHLQDSISFQGAVPNPSEYLKSAFCYLSTSRWEGMPISVLEALAHGIPAIVTDVVGNHDVITHGINGLIYPGEEPEKAAELLCAIADNNELWKKLSQNARRIAVEKYSAKQMVESTIKIYDQELADED